MWESAISIGPGSLPGELCSQASTTCRHINRCWPDVDTVRIDYLAPASPEHERGCRRKQGSSRSPGIVNRRMVGEQVGMDSHSDQAASSKDETLVFNFSTARKGRLERAITLELNRSSTRKGSRGGSCGLS